MAYPMVSRLACVFSINSGQHDVSQALRSARDAAIAAVPGASAWAGVARPVDAADVRDMMGGRPFRLIDAVIEVSIASPEAMSQLVDAARAIGQALDGLFDPKESGAVVGTAHCARSGESQNALIMTWGRDRRTDAATFVHWWQVHHSRFNLHSPSGARASRGFLSYQMVDGDDALSRAAASAAGLGHYDNYESIFVDDPERFVDDVVAAGHGTAAMYDEEGYISHEWRIGTPESAAEALRTGRDVMGTAMVDVLD